MTRFSTIHRLAVKELWSLARDPIMLTLIAYTFTVGIYVSATAMPETLNRAPIAIVDEDGSPLSARIAASFYPPQFKAPEMISHAQIDSGMDAGNYTFAITIPPDFQADVLAGRAPAVQLNVDATRMSQAFTGSGYIEQILHDEVAKFVLGPQRSDAPPIELVIRKRFNPNLTPSWFGSLMELINNVTMLSIVLTGAALIREREHGTIEHLLVMPVRPLDIMLAKISSMGLVVVLAASFSLFVVIRGMLHVPIEGSIPLFLAGMTLHLFATTSMGIFMATLARSMPQLGLLMILVLLPLEMLSGGNTPRESMPEFIREIMTLAPTTHFVQLSQAILYRGAGFAVVWKSLLYLLLIGGVFFAISLNRFRKAITLMT
jgi:ABC-2 type transport system permease protein